MHHIDINYLAVLVSGAVAFLIGGVWYGPLFGKSWMSAVGKTEEELKQNFNPVKTFGLAFIGHVAVSLGLAYLMDLTSAQTFSDAFRIAFVAWLCFSAATMFINFLFEGYKLKLLFINIGYQLVFFIMATFVLSLWH